ncbi:MAG: hypothetical protein Q9227_004414 [Pyrenula ochraceoflavens]
MSFRRSSRARTTQPPPSAPQHTPSSNSSNSLPRADRSTRSHQKLPSPNTSSARRSDSLENQDLATSDTAAARRSRRNDVDIDDPVKANGEEEDIDDPEGEEVTRCICGYPEYPGLPPQSLRDNNSRSTAKSAVKVESGQNGPAANDEAFSDDIGNFFIQCDKCQVWQHGGCVGLVDEAQTPEEYFCEQCRPNLHRLARSSNGSKPRSSRYLPVVEASSPSSDSSDDTQKPGSKARLTAAASNTKRRATMNSREAAYDEEEVLKRVIEESKETSGSLGKRGRDEMDENKSGTKRQRVSSGSPSSTFSKQSRSPSRQPFEEPSGDVTKTNGGSRKARGAAAKSQQEKEMRNRLNEREKHRLEQANKRNARSERRRAEESPPPSPSHSPSKATTSSQPATISHRAHAPDTPSSHRVNASSHKKTGRPPAKRGRLGRNQYTRDLPINGDDSPMRDVSREGGKLSPSNGANGVSGMHTESGKPSRPKSHASKTSMNEMKKRVAAILEFINHMRPVEGASSDGSSSTPNGASNGSVGNRTNASANVLIKGVEASLSGHTMYKYNDEDFRAMNSQEMMHALSRQLAGWQALHGKYGEK